MNSQVPQREVRQKPEKIRNGTAAGRVHMGRVKQYPCVICWAPPPSEAHHPICGRYGSRRSPDKDVIPLCIYCHRIGPLAIHQDKAGWIKRNGNDFDFLPIVADMLAGQFNYPTRG